MSASALRRVAGHLFDRRRDLERRLDEQQLQIETLNHTAQAMNHTLNRLTQVIETLNHDVRSGAPAGMALFTGYVERLRLDAETAIAATQVIERHLARIEALASSASE